MPTQGHDVLALDAMFHKRAARHVPCGHFISMSRVKIHNLKHLFGHQERMRSAMRGFKSGCCRAAAVRMHMCPLGLKTELMKHLLRIIVKQFVQTQPAADINIFTKTVSACVIHAPLER